MKQITENTSLEEIAVLVSETLEEAGITAVLSGGGAVTQYSDNEYMSTDLDFVTVERNKEIEPVVAKLGFERKGKDFYHPNTIYFIEFPAGPLSFGNSYVSSSDTSVMETKYGSLRIITPTQCLMDRLAWFIHGKDQQARDQAVMVAKRQAIDWEELRKWADGERIDVSVLDQIRRESEQ
jgi:hypothetical protein